MKIFGTAIFLGILFFCVPVNADASSTDQESSSGISSAPTNVILDYASTGFDSDLRPGDSGVLKVVAGNTGGQPADYVTLSVPGSSQIPVNRKWDLGRIGAGETKTVSCIVNIADNAAVGLHTLQAKIGYTGLNSRGVSETKELVLDIPVRIKGNPNFVLDFQKTVYLEGLEDDLKVDYTADENVKDLSVVLSSDCIDVVGSTKQHAGGLKKDQKYSMVYRINPKTPGMCGSTLSLSFFDDSGKAAGDKITFGLNILRSETESIQVTDFRLSNLVPGKSANMTLAIKNIGTAPVKNAVVSLDYADPFVPLQTSERYLNLIGPGEERILVFDFSVGRNAETKTYEIPLLIKYDLGEKRYSLNKSVGVEVSGDVIFEVVSLNVDGGILTVDVANLGTRTAYALKALLQTVDADKTLRDAEAETSYKDELRPNKETSFSFVVPAPVSNDSLFNPDASAKLVLEYTGLNNDRKRVEKSIVIPSPAPAGNELNNFAESSGGGNYSFPFQSEYLIAAVAVLAIIFLFYRKWKSQNA
jgi:hypothetical protein